MADDEPEVANEDDFEYDDTPYRDVQRLAPSFTVSVELHEEDMHADVWIFVDGADTRLVRQRFNYSEFHEDGTYERWLGQYLLDLWADPEQRDACGDCGNYRGKHAPDCVYYRWTNPTTA